MYGEAIMYKIAEFILFPLLLSKILSSIELPLCSASNLHCEHCASTSPVKKKIKATNKII